MKSEYFWPIRAACIRFHYGYQTLLNYPIQISTGKGRKLLASQTTTSKKKERESTAPSPRYTPPVSPSKNSHFLLFVLQLRKPLVHITVLPVGHARRPRLRVGIAGRPASHSAVRCAGSSRPRLRSVTSGNHRGSPATSSFLLKLLREWRAFPQGRAVEVDSVDGKDKQEGNGEQDRRGNL